MEQFLSIKILRALEFASVAHRDQLRYGPNKIPYISHPAAVGMILWKTGYSEDIVVAGILHDVIEDTSYTYSDIEKVFGQQIADWIAEVSEDTELPHDERKESYLTHLATASLEAKIISAADLLANRYDMLLDQQNRLPFWEKSPKKNIEHDLKRIAIIKTAISASLIEELENITTQVHQIFTKK